MTIKTIYINTNQMFHFEGKDVNGTLWGDHFEGLELVCTKYCDGSIDVDVYLANKSAFILALHNLKTISYGTITVKYEDLKEVKFDGK